ncbi:hypothetical protein CHS0354_022590 [Potamilus streckersoni]|uniref:Glycoside hydrolase family 38 N-terminal domain-containing protein n=1 Tax=Potamilus streckersoni TaxID=2493646 RepID=A0AAE0W172_9BIVA|nr:hypothetical protein CHS0354_022590 [Potamilus streckersoni]
MGDDNYSFRTFTFICIFISFCSGFRSHQKENVVHMGMDDVDIDEVHIIFMNHLDVGYDGIGSELGYINNILNVYFTHHFPQALNVSRQLIKGKYVESFIYTTHPWLVSLYLDCPKNLTLSGVTLKCPNKTEVAEFQLAISSGVITWHAGPMNMQIENMNQLLFELSLNMSFILDAQFGKRRAYPTLSQRDVPGLTHAAIPTLAKKGIAAVSVGVNPGTSPPAVPSIFKWRYEQDEVLAMWHPGGYPLNPGPNPANPGGLSRDDCVTVQGFSKALCFAFRTDNSGPPESVEEILGYYEILRAEFPQAKLRASTFEDFVAAVQPIKGSLPVVTKEIGDTWIQGIASDPKKMAQYRTVSETIMGCINAGKCSANDPRITDSVRYLIKPPEHTWGVPGVNDNVNWSNAQFMKARSADTFLTCEQSWREQRVFIDMAIEALGDHPVVADINYNLNQIIPEMPSLDGYEEVDPSQNFSYSDGMVISFGKDGSINYLFDPYNQMTWANGAGFGKFLYATYNMSDFDWMASMYNYYGGAGFEKTNSTENAHPESKTWDTKMWTLYKWKGDNFKMIVYFTMASYVPWSTYGAPELLYLQYVYRTPKDGAPAGFDATLFWAKKTVTRLPESVMYYFSPLIPESSANQRRWWLSKVGHLVDPSNVVLNGSQYVHAVDSGVYYIDENGNGLQLHTFDVPLVSIGTASHAPSPFPVPLTPIQQEDITGIAFNVYNNIWDTNYILWYPYEKGDENFLARFQINFFKK